MVIVSSKPIDSIVFVDDTDPECYAEQMYNLHGSVPVKKSMTVVGKTTVVKKRRSRKKK